MGCAALHGHDCQDARTCSGIDDVPALQVHACKGTEDEPCRLVAAGAEGHAGRDEDVVGCRRNVRMLHVVNDNHLPSFGRVKGKADRLKPFFLPDLVPVLVGSFGTGVADTDVGHEEATDGFLHPFLVPLALLYVCRQAVLSLGESLEPNRGKRGREDIGGILAERLQPAFNLIVLHTVFYIIICAKVLLFLHMGKFPPQNRRFPFGYCINCRNFAATIKQIRL